MNQCWNVVNWTLGTSFNEISIEIHTYSFKKMLLKMSSAKWRPFCFGLNASKWGVVMVTEPIASVCSFPFFKIIKPLFFCLLKNKRSYAITVASWWARWRLKSPASQLFTQPFNQAQIKEYIKAPRHWPLCGEFTGDRWNPAQKASNAENVSIWWRHHAD